MPFLSIQDCSNAASPPRARPGLKGLSYKDSISRAHKFARLARVVLNDSKMELGQQRTTPEHKFLGGKRVQRRSGFDSRRAEGRHAYGGAITRGSNCWARARRRPRFLRYRVLVK